VAFLEEAGGENQRENLKQILKRRHFQENQVFKLRTRLHRCRNLRAGERMSGVRRAGTDTGERAQMRCHAFDGGIFRVGREGAFFLYQLNVHTFNLEARSLYKAGGFNRRTDRRVKGWMRRDGWMGGRRNGY
jgi:hypothetical protein